jgi:hypothetical protein
MLYPILFGIGIVTDPDSIILDLSIHVLLRKELYARFRVVLYNVLLVVIIPGISLVEYLNYNGNNLYGPYGNELQSYSVSSVTDGISYVLLLEELSPPINPTIVYDTSEGNTANLLVAQAKEL